MKGSLQSQLPSALKSRPVAPTTSEDGRKIRVTIHYTSRPSAALRAGSLARFVNTETTCKTIAPPTQTTTAVTWRNSQRSYEVTAAAYDSERQRTINAGPAMRRAGYQSRNCEPAGAVTV
jgi:hypothetical protein